MYYPKEKERREVIDEDQLDEIEECVYTKNSLYLPLDLEGLFQKALINQMYLFRVQAIIEGMSRHPDFAIRLLLVQKLPRLAFLCFVEDMPQYVSIRLCPLLLSCLSDKNEEVRKACEISLIVIIKGKLLERETIVEKVCPWVVEISKTNGYASTVALMGKMAPLIGKEATEKYFLDVFVHLCSNEGYQIRMKCVKTLGDLSVVVGSEATEKHLLTPFIKLCRDENSEVRACCPEVAIPVSCTCSLTTRKTVLANAFADLLKDVKYSIRMSAYGFLGAFICTFAEPSVTKLDYDDNGELIFVGEDGYEFRMGSVHSNNSRDEEQYFGETRNQGFNRMNANTSPSYLNVTEQPSSGGSWSTSLNENNRWNKSWNSSEEEDVDDMYNTFRFWRTPLYELDLIDAEPDQDEIRTNLKILDNELSYLSEKLAECSGEDLEEMKTESLISCASSSDSGWNSAETTPHVESIPLSNPNVAESEIQSPNGIPSVVLSDQDVVPQVLLDSFVSMTSPMQGKGLEKEMAQGCAYCLPAVALTLGPSNWPYIKNAYKCLSMNIQWRVRKTVVSSIHKLASLVGEEVASKDLAPIFESFINDLDEVKIGAVKHLADFLKLVQPTIRSAFLPRLKDFLETDFDYNWRYREEFGEQLRLLIKLYSPPDWLEYFKPLAILLLCDKVAAVRQKAISLFLELIVNLSCESEYQEKLLQILVREFASNPSWRRRQIFVHLCSEIVQQQALNEKEFCNFLLGPLLLLQNDAVPNVGLCVARCLACDIVSTGYIGPSSPHYKSIMETLETLKRDGDSDIRYFASEHEFVVEKEKGNGEKIKEESTVTNELEAGKECGEEIIEAGNKEVLSPDVNSEDGGNEGAKEDKLGSQEEGETVEQDTCEESGEES